MYETIMTIIHIGNNRLLVKRKELHERFKHVLGKLSFFKSRNSEYIIICEDFYTELEKKRLHNENIRRRDSDNKEIL